jgi:hypothetical protein
MRRGGKPPRFFTSRGWLDVEPKSASRSARNPSHVTPRTGPGAGVKIEGKTDRDDAPELGRLPVRGDLPIVAMPSRVARQCHDRLVGRRAAAENRFRVMPAARHAPAVGVSRPGRSWPRDDRLVGPAGSLRPQPDIADAGCRPPWPRRRHPPDTPIILPLPISSEN